MVCRERMETPGGPRRVLVFLSREGKEGQARSARLPSRASSHWVRGNYGQLSLPSRPLPAAPRPVHSGHGCEYTYWLRKRGYGLASHDRARVAAWSPTPLIPAGLSRWAGVFSPILSGGLAGLDFGGNRIERAACARADQPQGCGVVCGDEGSEPRREGMTGPESSVPGLICSCSDFHCGTCARNRYLLVESGGSHLGAPIRI